MEKFSLLNSCVLKVTETSIVVDASKYIGELKEKVERLHRDVDTSQASSDHNSSPMQVTVETLESGFLINVFSEKNYPGLLVSILQVFEELGLDVSDARVSSLDNFRLEAVGEVRISSTTKASQCLVAFVSPESTTRLSQKALAHIVLLGKVEQAVNHCRDLAGIHVGNHIVLLGKFASRILELK
ncbi:hypothetical protein RJ639_005995 [Escallonia herrerae]|uniref:Plant bHLH transcription factor ACT-like domain-containing protein n=1 Tax=Escallonia herrerae TaxID=1293975 RepID=A0AA89AZW7_9ASTE|nr:hypothetical protein RJ639_005995 [Escallonia herrerae]